MAKKKFKFKPEATRGKKISVYNKTLGRHLKLSKEQVLGMAERGALTESQMKALFQPTPTKEG